MSKAPEHIEKILLAVGIIAGGALATFGYLKLSQAEEDFSQVMPTPRDSEVSVNGASEVSEALNSLQSERVVEAASVPSTRLASGQRDVNLFVGVPLFAEKGRPNKPVDLLRSENVHPPIPNEWWLEYEISPAYANSPSRDADEDGFTNLEEFKAGTSPVDDGAHPELAMKLAFRDEESVRWFVEFGFESGGKWTPKIQNLTTGEKNRVDFGNALEPGDAFFGDEPFKDRFQFVKIEERTEMNKRLNYEQTLKYAIFKDLKPNKAGKTYEIPSSLPRAEEPEYHHYDRTAVVELQAIGERGKMFKVEESTRFALPHGEGEKKYLLKSVTPEQIEIEWQQEGRTRTRIIPRT